MGLLELDPISVLTALLAKTARLWPAVLLALAVLVVRALAHRRFAARGRATAQYVTAAAPPEVDPGGALGAWRRLGAIQSRTWRRILRGQPHLVWEYAWSGTELSVRVWVPGTVNPGIVEQAITSGWPGATTTTVPATAPLPETGALRGGHIVWSGEGQTPIEMDDPIDLLRGLLEAGPSTDQRRVALVQITARPASRRRVVTLRRSATGPGGRTGLFDELLSFVFPRFGGKTPAAVETPAERQRRTALGARLTGQMWHVGIRWAAAGPEQTAAQVTIHEQQLDAGIVSMLGWGHRRRRQPRLRAVCNLWAGPSRAVMLNAAELARIAHLPHDAVVPSLERAGARAVAAPRHLTTGGRHTATIGTAAVGGQKVTLAAVDGRFHTHIMGKTGSGKSTMLQHLALADIRDRRGLVLLDPAGDLVDDILDRLDPDEVAGRLYLIDPRLDRQPGLDPLAGDDEHLMADNLVAICRSIWPRFWGPRADDVLRFALLTLKERNQPLTMLPNLLMSKRFRNRLIAEIQKVTPAELPPSGVMEDGDMTGIPGFWGWFGGMNEGNQNQAAGPVLSRMRALMSRPFVRQLCAAPDEALFDMGTVLDRGGIVLARLPEGEIGPDTAKLVGNLLRAKVWQAVTARAAVPEAQRADCAFRADEAQKWMGEAGAVEAMLAEARKYHLGVTLAHQYLAQMPKEMAAAVSGQARTKLYFSLGPEDAKLAARHMLPLTEHDLAHLDDYTAAARLYSAGKELPAFTVNGLPPAPVIGKAETIRAAALARLHSTPTSAPVSASTAKAKPAPVVESVTVAVPPGPFTRHLWQHLAGQPEAAPDAAPRDTHTRRSDGERDSERQGGNLCTRVLTTSRHSCNTSLPATGSSSTSSADTRSSPSTRSTRSPSAPGGRHVDALLSSPTTTPSPASEDVPPSARRRTGTRSATPAPSSTPPPRVRSCPPARHGVNDSPGSPPHQSSDTGSASTNSSAASSPTPATTPVSHSPNGCLRPRPPTSPAA